MNQVVVKLLAQESIGLFKGMYSFLNRRKELQIESKRLDNEYLIEKQKLDYELKKLKLQKDAVLKLFKEQRKLIKTAFEPDIKVLSDIRSVINNNEKEIKKLNNEIINSNCSLEEKRFLREVLQDFMQETNKCIEQEQTVLAKNKDTLRDLINNGMNHRGVLQQIDKQEIK